MAATPTDIEEWAALGRQQGATHLIVVADLFDVVDYPEFVAPGEDVEAKLAEIRKFPMAEVLGVHDLRSRSPAPG